MRTWRNEGAPTFISLIYLLNFIILIFIFGAWFHIRLKVNMSHKVQFHEVSFFSYIIIFKLSALSLVFNISYSKKSTKQSFYKIISNITDISQIVPNVIFKF